MSMEKSIRSGKEHRQPYRGSKAADPSCRNHGGCDWCKGNRMYRALKEDERTRSAASEALLLIEEDQQNEED